MEPRNSVKVAGERRASLELIAATMHAHCHATAMSTLPPSQLLEFSVSSKSIPPARAVNRWPEVVSHRGTSWAEERENASFRDREKKKIEKGSVRGKKERDWEAQGRGEGCSPELLCQSSATAMNHKGFKERGREERERVYSATWHSPNGYFK